MALRVSQVRAVSNSTAPTVSVIMPAFNRAHLIGDAISSILGQTLADFELLIVDDGSSDGTASLARSFDDPRLRVVQHETNLGIPQARNTGLEHARGKYVAWLDSDDVARPHRLQAQVDFLSANPHIAMIGCCAGKIGQGGRRKSGVRVPPLDPRDIKAWLLFRSAFQQSSIMGRADILKAHPYDDDYPVCEDHDVFIRLSESHQIQNVPQVLIDRRLHAGQTVRVEEDSIQERKMRLLGASLDKLGLAHDKEELRRHVLLGGLLGYRPDAEFLAWAEAWLMRMQEANRRSAYVDADALAFAAAHFWMLACLAAAPEMGRSKAARTFLTSPVSKGLWSRNGRRWAAEAVPLALRLRT